jgi:hypothetical protein
MDDTNLVAIREFVARYVADMRATLKRPVVQFVFNETESAQSSSSVALAGLIRAIVNDGDQPIDIPLRVEHRGNSYAVSCYKDEEFFFPEDENGKRIYREYFATKFDYVSRDPSWFLRDR